MMKKYLMLSVVVLWAGHAWSDTVSDSLQTKLNAIRSMSANFNQVVHAKQRELSRSTGTMALLRPGHFKWQTQSPMEQVLVADGEHLWIYDVDLEQVTVKKQQKGLGGTAALFLSGYDDRLTNDFEVTHYTRDHQDYYELRSKLNKANFQRMILVFMGDELKGLELFDQLGQHTTVTLTHIKNNPKLAANLFAFKIPKGVDVVEQ
jgi:outer membrane lipoprotein carrier protein